MASSLDRSEREAAKKKNEAAEERKRVKEDRKNDVQAKKQRKSARSKNKKKSAARYDTRAMMKTMAMSVSILLLVFLLLREKSDRHVVYEQKRVVIKGVPVKNG